MGFDWIVLKNYKRHYICLSCHKGFKRTSKKDMKYSKTDNIYTLMNEYYTTKTEQSIIAYIDAAHQEMKIVCPNCSNPMLQVHYNFEVPTQRDKKAWRELERTMSPKRVMNYDNFIFWHKQELKKETKGSELFNKLKRNLEKLEKANEATSLFF